MKRLAVWQVKGYVYRSDENPDVTGKRNDREVLVALDPSFEAGQAVPEGMAAMLENYSHHPHSAVVTSIVKTKTEVHVP